MKFNMGKQRLLCLGWNNPTHQCRCGAREQLCKRTWSWSPWTKSEQYTPTVVDTTVNCINQQTEGSRYSLVSHTCESALETTVPHFVLPTTGKILSDWTECSEGPPKCLREWNISYLKRR